MKLLIIAAIFIFIIGIISIIFDNYILYKTFQILTVFELLSILFTAVNWKIALISLVIQFIITALLYTYISYKNDQKTNH